MDAKELIIGLAQKEIQLGLEGGDIKVFSPKGMLTEELIESLQKYKANLVGLIKEKMNRESLYLPEIVNDLKNRFLPFALNDVQQAYWIGRKNVFELGNIATHVYQEFEGKNLDLSRLQKAINKLIQRHEMLRAIILESGEQIILQKVPAYELRIVDLRGKSQGTTERKLQEIRKEMSHQVLPSHQWPLFDVRATIYQDGIIRLHISLDMLIIDMLSITLLAVELIQFYIDPELVMPALELSFRDYVLAEQKLPETDAFKRAKSFWMKQIDLLPAGPELPIAKPMDAVSNVLFARRGSILTKGKWDNLKKRAKELGLTPSVVLLTAYSAVLAAWSKNLHFSVNLTLFRRLPLHSQVNQIIGDFTSVVLMEIDFTSPDTFMEYARQIQRRMYQNLDNTFFSGIELLREMATRREGKNRTLMPVVFTSGLGFDLTGSINIDELPTDVFNLLQSFAQHNYGVSQTPQVWLDHQVFEFQGELTFNWDAIDELFPAGMIDDMFHCYCDLLEKLSNPEFNWDQQIHPLPQAQMEQRLRVNATGGPVTDKLLHTFFLEQVKSFPEKDAVITSNYKLSYAQLFKCSNQLARKLREMGAKPNTLIAVVMEKGWEQIAAVYGILFAGAAYLPIDAGVPPERLEYLLEAGECRIAVTQEKYAASLNWPEQIRRISVTDNQLDSLDSSALDVIQKPTDLAYVIFTSGSTGTPKGVVIDHRGAVNTILDVNQRFGVTGGDCAFAISNLNFDLSVYDIFGLLGLGGSIVIPDAAGAKDPAHWLSLMKSNRVTLWSSVPALMQMLVEYAGGTGKQIPESLRLIMMSGDWIPVSLPGQIWEQLPQAVLYSLGGATEASIWSNYYPIKRVDPEWTSIPYGVPLRNQSFQVYNEKLEPVPVWTPGQLYIGGIGLAKGYWKDEEKTKASFIIHPVTGERLYRTGDLGRYLPDGNLEFLGREDSQVKISGYRIELGEIESALTRYEAVKLAVVSTFGSKTQKRLAGYIVPADYEKASATKDEFYAGINQYLRTQIPEYMVPEVYVLLKELPLSANGKVDRKRLPEPTLAITDGHKERIVPATEVEKKIAEIWKSELKLENISVNDNFFSSGGDSLVGVRINNRISKEFSIDLPLRTLFEKQTIVEFAGEVEKALKEGCSGSSLGELPTITADPAGRYLPFPLTDIQQAYLLGRSGSFELGNVATHIYQEFEIKNLEVPRLNGALNQLIARHDMLRTIILNANEQKISEEVEPYVIETYDLRRLKKDERETWIREIRERMAHKILPADKWPLFDIKASIVKKDSIRLHIYLDMLIMDFTSVMLFFSELMKLYENPVHSLEKISISYRDYVIAERTIKRTTLYQKSKDYWLSKLASIPPAPELPLAINPRTIAAPRFKRRLATLPQEQWNRLKGRAKQESITPSGVLFTAYAAIIASWSKGSQFTLNLTMANRLPLHPEVHRIIGDFTSVTLVGLDHLQSDSFLSWANYVQKALIETLDHPYFTGVEVLRELASRQGGMQGVMMPVIFTSGLGLDGPVGQDELGRGIFDGEIIGLSETPQVWLDHQVFEFQGELTFNWDAIDELFPAGMIDDMFHCYCDLLEKLSNPEFNWDQQIHPLPQAQMEQRLRVNATGGPVTDKLLHTFFLEQVKSFPEKDAVITSNYKLSYAQLFKCSNQLARKLREMGAKPNTLIAVVMEKGWEQIAAVYGILFAGAAYLPIDAGVPPERLEYLLEAGECRIAVTQEKYAASLNWPEQIRRISVTDNQLDSLDSSALDVIQKPTDLAYVIFTSGSTGTPKGVVIDHRGAVNTILDVNQRFGVTGGDCAFAISNLNFDLSVYDIFGLLGLGGSIVIPDAAGAKDPAHWLSLMKSNRVTLWSSVPALMQMLVEYAGGTGKQIPESLRLIMMSGDWIPVSLPGQIWEQLPQAVLYSLGGATEASIWSNYYPIKRVDPEWTSIPYGVPLRNQSFQVYNEKLEPVPVWTPGQLYIGGIGLAKGYWKDEEKTKASFIIHPVTGERLYRTGDLGRYLPDGNLEFLGREDSQVKISGYRIELGEIESALTRYEAVKLAVVSTFGSKTQKRLAGYIVPADYEKASATKDEFYAGINQYLRTQIPEYMVPEVYVLLKELPLSANGKVDRKRLPEPTRSVTDDLDYAEPLDEVEKGLATIWQEVLEVDRIGRNDNFFELGGHSLNATTMAAKVHQQFQVELPLRELFSRQTVKELSEYIKTKETTDFITINPVGEKEYYRVSSAQKRLYLTHMVDRTSTSYNIPLAVEISGKLDRKRFEEAFQTLVNRHESLRTSFEFRSGEIVQQIHPELKLRIDHFQINPGLQVSKVIQKFIKPFDLSQAPLLRVGLIELSVNKRILLCDMHHIISDGLSMNILIKEFFELYQDGKLAPLRIHYKDYSEWQSELFQTALFKKQEEYWHQVLEGKIPVLKMPLDFDRPANRTFAGATVQFGINKVGSEKIHAFAQKYDLTINILLFALYGLLINQYSRQNDIIIGSLVAGRRHADLENIIGVFMNFLPIRIRFNPEQNFLEYLNSVKEVMLNAYENQDFPFEMMVEQANYKAEPSRNPLFDTMLVFHNEINLQGGWQWNDLTFNNYKIDRNTSTLDLKLDVFRNGGGFDCTFEYNTHLFKPETIQRTAEHFNLVIEKVLEI